VIAFCPGRPPTGCSARQDRRDEHEVVLAGEVAAQGLGELVDVEKSRKPSQRSTAEPR
jgi:hypothetical protein